MAIADVVAPVVTVAVVSAATALVGMEFEREAVRSASREGQIDQQRLDFERLYEVSATLARAESLAEIVPHLVGTICKYLDAQVGDHARNGDQRHTAKECSDNDDAACRAGQEVANARDEPDNAVQAKANAGAGKACPSGLNDVANRWLSRFHELT